MPSSLDPRFASIRSKLALFPEEHAQALGAMVQRLSALIGRMNATYFQGVDPDGFDGVEQRGEYHRLLTSEWLLAEEVPDEFLRRAAMNEHLFLRLARSEPQGGRRTLVFLDAGPMQLGSPRLVHLALLLVLEHRAALANADFQWSIIQEPTSQGRSADEDELRQLLKTRSAQLAHKDSAAALLSEYKAPQQGDDLWWIGDAQFIEQNDLPGSTLSIADELLQDGDSLRLTVKQGKRSRSVSLPLPLPHVRTRLMRHPFEAFQQAETASAVGKDFILSHCGEIVFVVSDTHVRTFRIKSNLERLSFSRLDSGKKLVGIARDKRDTVRIYRQDGSYSLEMRRGPAQLNFRQRKPAPPLGNAPLWAFFLMGKSAKKLVLRDAEGTVFVGLLEGNSFELRPVLDRCLHLIWRRGYLEYATRSSDLRLDIGRLNFDFQLRPSRGPFDSVRPPRIVWGFHRATQTGAIAHAEPTLTHDLSSGKAKVGFQRWAISSADLSTTGSLVRETLQVVGLARLETFWAPIVLNEYRTELRVEAAKYSYVLATFNSPVEHCEMAHEQARLMCLVGGQLICVDIPESGPATLTRITVPPLPDSTPTEAT